MSVAKAQHRRNEFYLGFANFLRSLPLAPSLQACANTTAPSSRDMLVEQNAGLTAAEEPRQCTLALEPIQSLVCALPVFPGKQTRVAGLDRSIKACAGNSPSAIRALDRLQRPGLSFAAVCLGFFFRDLRLGPALANVHVRRECQLQSGPWRCWRNFHTAISLI
jgi:hypothetical protein